MGHLIDVEERRKKADGCTCSGMSTPASVSASLDP